MSRLLGWIKNAAEWLLCVWILFWYMIIVWAMVLAPKHPPRARKRQTRKPEPPLMLYTPPEDDEWPTQTSTRS